MAIRLFYNDGTSKLMAAGGTPEEQVVLYAKLEEMEAKGKVLMEKLHPIVNEIFAHLPSEDRQQVLDSPQRLRLAMRTLSEQDKTQPSYTKALDEIQGVRGRAFAIGAGDPTQ